MKTSSRSSISPAIARTLTATIIAVILVAANFTIVNAQQQTQLQSSSDGGGAGGGLTATINGGDTFTTGETVIISGSVAQRGTSSNVVIEITDPQGQLVKRGFPALTPTDNTFTYTFVAGEQEQFDTNAPMVASGNYLVKVSYFPSSGGGGGGVVPEEVELSFVYNASTTATSSGAITDSGVGASQPSSTATPTTTTTVPVTTTTSQQAPIQNGVTTSPTTATVASTFFQSTNDSFSIQVPQGWQIQDLNNPGVMLPEEAELGYGILAQLCPEEEVQQQQPPSTLTNASNTHGCIEAQDEVIHIVRYPNLDSGVIQTSNNSTSATTAGASFNSNNNQTTTPGAATTTTTIDNILAYHLQKLQEVGYNNIEIVNNVDTRVNLTMAQANQTVTTLPAKFAEMTYTTASAPDEIKRGYFILTATNATAPNFGITKGYSVFYEGSTLAPTEITTTSSALSSLPPVVGQVFDSFELIVAPEVEQALAQQSVETTEPIEDTADEDEESVEEEEEDGGDDCHPSYPDTCIPPPPPNLNCDDIEDTNFEVEGSDPHGFDGNNDGIGCESDGEGGEGGGGEGGEGGGGEGGEGGGGEGGEGGGGEGGEGGGGEGGEGGGGEGGEGGGGEGGEGGGGEGGEGGGGEGGEGGGGEGGEGGGGEGGEGGGGEGGEGGGGEGGEGGGGEGGEGGGGEGGEGGGGEGGEGGE